MKVIFLGAKRLKSKKGDFFNVIECVSAERSDKETKDGCYSFGHFAPRKAIFVPDSLSGKVYDMFDKIGTVINVVCEVDISGRVSVVDIIPTNEEVRI